MFSGVAIYRSPIANYTPFDIFAQSFNCTQDPGPARLTCLQAVPADAIKNFTNADPADFSFGDVVVDKSVVHIPLLSQSR